MKNPIARRSPSGLGASLGSTFWRILVAALLVASPGALSAGEPAGDSPGPLTLDGRSRIELRAGASNVVVSHDDWSGALDVTGGEASLAFVHWAHEHLALELSLGVSNVGVSRRRSFHGETVRTEALYRVLAGGRFYLPVPGTFRPHLDVLGGIVTEIAVDDRWRRTEVASGPTKAGLEVGGGVDFLLGRHFVIGVRAAALLREGHRGDFSVSGALGWNFGGHR